MTGGHPVLIALWGFIYREKIGQNSNVKQAHKRRKLWLSYSLEEKSVIRCLFSYCLLSLKPPTLYVELFF